MMDKLIEEYLRGIELVNAAVHGVSEPLLSYKPADNAWSIKEIIVHLCDADLVAVHRMKKIIAEENPLLTAFDQDLWTSRLHYADLNHEPYLQMFRMLRESMAVILRALPEQAWARTGIHNVAGKITLQDVVESYIGHVNDHLRQMERNKQAFKEQ